MTTPEKKFVRLRTYGKNWHTTHVELADHPHEVVGCVESSINVGELIPGYNGPFISIQFDKDKRAIGIEILHPYGEEEVEDEDEIENEDE